MNKLIEADKYIGHRFGKLIILGRGGYALESNGRVRRPLALCRCDCGKEKSIRLKDILSAKTISCSCYGKLRGKENNKTHGMSNTTEYYIYNNMISRCTRVDFPQYKGYGGRGIKVCDRWLESFENFFADMGFRPSKNHSIDRMDNDGNYEPSNCKWSTRKEQAANTRGNPYSKLYTYNNESLHLKDWANKYGINYYTLWGRIKKGNMSIGEAILFQKNNTLKFQRTK